MFNTDFSRIGFFVCVAITAIFFAEALYLAFVAPAQRKRSINRRLKAIDGGVLGEQALIQLRAERGIFDRNLAQIGSLARLLVQSGLRLTLTRYIFLCMAAGGGVVCGSQPAHLMAAMGMLPGGGSAWDNPSAANRRHYPLAAASQVLIAIARCH